MLKLNTIFLALYFFCVSNFIQAISYHIPNTSQYKEEIITALYENGAIKYGNFTLKSGQQSNIYIDLRGLISTPDLLIKLAGLIDEETRGLSYDLICGVPYTALPIATTVSILFNKPMIMHRKEGTAKTYGTKKVVEGNFKPHNSCLIIEDVITTGGSVLETTAILENEELIVRDILVIVDREQGGKEMFEQKGYRVHALFTLTELTETLRRINS